MSKTIMIQGTMSDAGKSVLVAGLCRYYRQHGFKVAPFKPQNMSLNSAVTVDGGEIGRAQALQAFACDLEPHTDMNPVLLKPSSDTGAQIIVHGKVRHTMDARAYHNFKPELLQAVLQSHQRLAQHYDLIIVEGAGSPAEINLRDRDIANMGFAEAVDCPVVLVGDIDRGGVFAQLFGTLALLSVSEQARIRGFIINKFRGDVSLLQSGLEWLETQTNKPSLGVIPYLHGLYLDAEDALPRGINSPESAGKIRIIAPALPRISNHTDFDALRLHPQILFEFIGPNQTIPAADLIVLPGSKNTRADLDWLRQQGWEQAIAKHLRYGGKLLGICGGFQMLGTTIEDPLGLEDQAGTSSGLNYLEMNTLLKNEKRLARVSGKLILDDAEVIGYEIHLGESTGPALQRPLVKLAQGTDGAISMDGQIMGTYLHGIFDHPAALTALLSWAGLQQATHHDLAALRNQELDRVAASLSQHCQPLDWLEWR